MIPLDFPAFKKVRVNNSLILTAASHFLSPMNFLTRAFAVSNVSVMRKNVKDDIVLKSIETTDFEMTCPVLRNILEVASFDT